MVCSAVERVQHGNLGQMYTKVYLAATDFIDFLLKDCEWDCGYLEYGEKNPGWFLRQFQTFSICLIWFCLQE